MPSCFPPGDEARRILFALGFIQGGTAGTWANNHANKMLDPTAPNPFTTFQEFQSTFEHGFGAADHAQKARTDMAALKMKPGDTVEEYTTAFEALQIHTSYNEAAHVEAYRSGLHHRIVEKIYGDSNGELPADLEAWKTKARRLDNLHLEFKALQSRPQGLPTHIRPRPQFVRAPVTPAPANQQAPRPSPDAMDVDSGRGRSLRCYNCNKFGHIARLCKEPRQFRSIRATEIAEVVRAVISETAQPKEEVVTESMSDFPPSQQ